MAAKTTTTAARAYSKVKVTRTGVHAKTKSSKLKNSKNYRKAYKGQG